MFSHSLFSVKNQYQYIDAHIRVQFFDVLLSSWTYSASIVENKYGNKTMTRKKSYCVTQTIGYEMNLSGDIYSLTNGLFLLSG